MMTTVVVTTTKRKAPQRRYCGVETTQKTLHGMQMGETTMECSVVLLIPPSGGRLIVCIQILARMQEILGLELPLME